ncbi:hypothetical protein GLOIN_2v1765919 [Rhizophagus irregularis DAOM 181602=DAOM 197198]|uniref:Uncharacterized protein n=2 Tax=Rhizophagus irregularis TaxID=588596 RepID=A0A2P4QN84_RHIID|nr:hypothetical protein GLOIN_2v1765919 [Rhizophagus irregularis DAOM 181602=DAOM 197198]POG79113.1 hypothetical protein GLOIN_2v1765919 [Rhizophagus irregularis DAOM 181602=DAOM 197198]|eukprot:XP_025185979.1 hypothetical protein GLOIN_2v1765919 [Rhizophagus irregularis DAOM 181602=DAOM 197198]
MTEFIIKIIHSKHFIRWYDAGSGLKMRQDWDNWQLDILLIKNDGKRGRAFFEEEQFEFNLDEVNVSSLQTPPGRIYMELTNMASRNNKNFPPPVTRNENEKSNLEEEKVVGPITSTNELREKLTVLEEIFEESSNLMEWEHINLQAVMDVKKENGFNVGDVSPKFKNWAMQTNNFLLLGNKIISHAEQNKILQEYTKLNDDFTHNLKEEHRWTDEKETGEKRPKPVSPKNEIVIARQKQEQKDRTKKKREE